MKPITCDTSRSLRLPQYWLIFLVIALGTILITACSQTESTTDYLPAGEVDLELMAAEYPAQYEQWESSVHGQAYLDGDTNAPACLDCHADPESGEIETAAFQLDIPNRCGRCHADKELMADYDVSADVYETYLADYHGTTVAYYRATDPDSYRYEAVCSDCHGSHAVYAPENEQSSVHPANLATTCQTCHHDAPENFAMAFGHYRPARTPVSSAENPLVFWVKLIYQAAIPVTLGGMLAYIGLDVRYRLQKRKNHHDDD